MRRRSLACAAAALGAAVAIQSPVYAGPVESGVVQGLGPVGTATMHGDAQSSDTTPFAGPGVKGLATKYQDKTAACPTILAGSDGMMWALCTQIFGRAPVALVLDPADGATLASLPISKGALLGGVYAYVDDQDRLVLVDGKNTFLRLAKQRGADGKWSVTTSSAQDVSAFVTAGGTQPNDAVVGLTPDAHGHVWLATREGKVGVLDPATGQVKSTQFPAGERVDNSISASSGGVAIATSHALYLLNDPDGATPTVVWRQAYDRGSARKPGQLAWGTGATPSFFGPEGSDRYVTITDNADRQEHLLVYRVSDGSLVCSEPIFAPGASGTENSAMAHDRSVIVASTYGYPYPALPEGAGTSVPSSAQFATGGMERIDVNADETGCHKAWAQPVLSSAVPRWSLGDNTIYTIERPAVIGLTGSTFNAITIDPATGETTSRQRVMFGGLRDTLEMVGTITPDGVWWQGTITGVLRLQAAGA